jgi:hypothetical protein
MTFQPAPTVSIGGVDYTGDTINAVQIRRGRDTVYAEPQPGFASFQLIDKTGDGIPIEVGDRVLIDLEPGRRVFFGTVTDWTATLYDAGLRDRPAALVSITAVGPLLRFNRRVIYFDGRQAETDGARILDIVTEALSIPWEEAVGTWADGVGTWEDQSAQPFDADLIDPGVFDLAAVPANDSGYVALTLAQEAASSGEGILFETADGFIGFANADRRPANRAAGAYQIAENLVRADLDTTSQLADITNRVTVNYATGSVSDEDVDSIQRFGPYASQIDTQLVNLTNAEARAESFLARHAVPTVQMGSVAVRLDGLEQTLADDLLDLDLNDAVRVPVPTTMGPTNRTGFIEQVVLRFDPFRAEVVWNVSDYRLSEASQRWGQVDPTLAWEDVSATLAWQDATTVTA